MNNAKSGSISFTGIMIRIVVSLLLVLLTYNPGGYSYFHWVLVDLGAFDALKGFVGAVLLVAWVVCVRTALVSLGSLGSSSARLCWARWSGCSMTSACCRPRARRRSSGSFWW